MNRNIIILLFMLFAHIVDDYYLQGFLASAKQKSWWEKNFPDELYKNDYKMALFEHAFSWSFMINLPILVYVVLFGGKWNLLMLVVNVILHALIDDQKANKKTISLVQDQTVHFAQILVTWAFWVMKLCK